MSVRVRTEGLRKIYTSAPPVAAEGIVTGAAKRRREGKRRAAEIVAVDGLTLEIHPGETFGLLGPNGAGKSTTVGILTTRIRPTSGTAWIGDLNVWVSRVAVKRLIGVVPQRPNLDFSLTAREILTFHGAYFGLGSRERGRRADDLLARLQLADRADHLTLGFSGGMRQRLSIARALMHEPRVLFLDEPSAGLDPQTRLLLWEMIEERKRAGMTVLITTHNMEEADRLSDRVAIVDHGKVIAVGTPAELKRSIPGGYLVRLHFSSAEAGLVASLGRLPGVTEARAAGDGSVHLYADRGGPLIPLIVQTAAGAGSDLHDVHISEPSLENLFLHHTGRSLRE